MVELSADAQEAKSTEKKDSEAFRTGEEKKKRTSEGRDYRTITHYLT